MPALERQQLVAKTHESCCQCNARKFCQTTHDRKQRLHCVELCALVTKPDPLNKKTSGCRFKAALASIRLTIQGNLDQSKVLKSLLAKLRSRLSVQGSRTLVVWGRLHKDSRAPFVPPNPEPTGPR